MISRIAVGGGVRGRQFGESATNRQRGSAVIPIGLWHEEKRHFSSGTEFRDKAAISATAAISAVWLRF